MNIAIIELYDREGKLMDDLREYFKLRADVEYMRVGWDEVHGAKISTVWLGHDHQYGDGPPLIFETMVFGGELDCECVRYSTLDEARAGHAAMVQRVMERAV